MFTFAIKVTCIRAHSRGFLGPRLERAFSATCTPALHLARRRRLLRRPPARLDVWKQRTCSPNAHGVRGLYAAHDGAQVAFRVLVLRRRACASTRGGASRPDGFLDLRVPLHARRAHLRRLRRVAGLERRALLAQTGGTVLQTGDTRSKAQAVLDYLRTHSLVHF
jgi:hypothetical protein